LRIRPKRGAKLVTSASQTLLAALQRPGFNIAGLRRADLLPLLGQSSPATLSRQLARLRHLGVIYEAAGRIGEAITSGFRARGFHGCLVAIFAGAVAAGRLLQLDPTGRAGAGTP
jgi:hypothetical protein